MGNQIWEQSWEGADFSVSAGGDLAQFLPDLSKPAGSARTPKHPLDFQQAPWHFPSSAASRTSSVDLQLETCLESSWRLCQGEGAKHHEPLQTQAGRCFLCCFCEWWKCLEGPSRFCREELFVVSFPSFSLLLSPPHLFLSPFLPPLCWSEDSKKLKCILQWRMFCLAWSKAALYISGHMLNPHNVSCFLVFKAKSSYHCLRT